MQACRVCYTSAMCWYHDVELEPGLLKIFRVFTAAVSVFFFLFYIFPVPKFASISSFPSIFAFMGLGYGCIFIYLSIPLLRRLMKMYYLPFAILASIFIPIGIINWTPQLQDTLIMHINPLNSWSVTILLLFPLIITAWQYSFHMVLILFAVLGILDPLISILAFELEGQEMYQMIYASAVRIVSFTAIGYVITELMNNQRDRQRDLAAANRKLEEYARSVQELAVIRERNRLASELHDVLAHTLSGLTVHLEAIDSIIPASVSAEDEAEDKLSSSSSSSSSSYGSDQSAAFQRIHAELQRAMSNARQGLQETRRALQDLRSEPLEEFGFDYAVKRLADAYAARSGLSINLEYTTPMAYLTETIEQHLYRIIQEALENIHRHARAEHVNILFRSSRNLLFIDITDDGIGFNVPETGSNAFAGDKEEMSGGDSSEPELTHDHFGLYGMKIRARECGGTVQIDSAPGKGTAVHIAVPSSQEEI